MFLAIQKSKEIGQNRHFLTSWGVLKMENGVFDSILTAETKKARNRKRKVEK